MNTAEFDTDIIQVAEDISRVSQAILKQANLSDEEHQDISAINGAIHKFIHEAQQSKDIITAGDMIEAKKKVRHNLRNHLNIVVGFSSLLIKENSADLLLNMISIQKIHENSEKLLARVDSIL